MKMLRYEDIPNKAFMKALKVRDIRRARILSRQEKIQIKAGNSDIVLESPLGFADNIDRNIFTKLYKHINGGKIELMGWKHIHKYLVVSADNTEVYAMYVPIGYSVKINKAGKTIVANNTKKPKGDYIVCGVNPDGTINRDQVFCINNIMYKKMFIPSTQTEYLTTSKKVKHESPAVTAKVEQRDTIQNKEEYTAIAQLVRNGKLIGFIIQDKNGHRQNIDKTVIMALCQEKKVSNICIVDQDGKKFIRGVGIKISELPICPM